MMTIALCCAAWGSTAVSADESLLASVLEDTQLYFTAPVRWDEEDWLAFGGTLALVGASHEFDERVRMHFATGANAVLTGEDKHSLRDALPSAALIVATGVGAAFYRDQDGYEETRALLEAAVFSSATGEILGYAAGRERPDATTSANQWRQGGDSFPSLHTSAAFAVGMVFAESGNDEYRWLRRLIGYSIAGATGYIRIHDNDHWLSDTVAGAAVGISTARFVLNREGAWRQSDLTFAPFHGGWQLAYSIRTR
jgi:membrane-associated phospholipid phosphatase